MGLAPNVIFLRIVEEEYRKFRSGNLTFEDAFRCGKPTVGNDDDLRDIYEIKNSIMTTPIF